MLWLSACTVLPCHTGSMRLAPVDVACILRACAVALHTLCRVPPCNAYAAAVTDAVSPTVITPPRGVPTPPPRVGLIRIGVSVLSPVSHLQWRCMSAPLWCSRLVCCV